LHQNAFGGRAPPGPAGGAIALPLDPLAVIRGGDGREGKGRKGRGREGRGGEGEGGEGKGEGKGHSNPLQKSLATGLGGNNDGG